MQNPRFCLIIVIGLPINVLPVRAGRKAFCSRRFQALRFVKSFALRTVHIPNWCLSLSSQNTFPGPVSIHSITPTFYRWGNWGTGQDISNWCRMSIIQPSRLKALCAICLNTASLITQVSDNCLYMASIRSVRNTHSWKCSVLRNNWDAQSSVSLI